MAELNNMEGLNNPINEEEKEELDMNQERINRSENDTNEHCEALCESEEIPETESLLEAEEMYEEDESLLEDEEMYEEDELPEEDEESVAKMPEAEEESNSLEAEEKDTISDAERKRKNAERRRKRARQIRMEAPLDEYGRPIDEHSLTGTFDPVLSELSRQRATREIIRSTIIDVRPGRKGREGWVELRHLNYRVLIPFSEMDIEVVDRPDEEEEDHAKRVYKTLANMLGARIDFIITGIDPDNDLIAGSRAMATRIRRRDILNARDREGNYLIYPGRQVQGNVLAVHQNFAWVDVYGMRVRIRTRDISSDYTAHAYDALQNGMSVPLYIVQVDRDDDGNVTMLYVSMRNDAKEREQKERISQSLKTGDECLGRVTNRTGKAIFLTLNNGLQAMAFVSNGLRGRRVPNIGDTVALRVLSIEKNRDSGNPIVRGRIIRSINYTAR